MLDEDIQKLEVDAIITLFTLDATLVGGSVYRFTPMSRLDKPADAYQVKFQGNLYTPVDIQVEGFEVTSKGQLPQPTFRIANTTRLLVGAVVALDDLVGTKVTRLRTLKKYLDGEAAADPTAYFTPDVFKIAQKTAQNKLFIEFRLEADIDLEGIKIPGRQIIRNWCSHTYRVWNGSSFDYTNADCPYAEAVYFNSKGESTAVPAEDQCGKRLTDCQKRFGNTTELPAWSFPGAGRF